MMKTDEPAIDLQQINHNRGTRAFRPVLCGNFVISFWSQRFSVERVTRFCTQYNIPLPPTPDLFGVSIFERMHVMGREVMQPVQYSVDPRFSHFPWAQFRARIPSVMSECFLPEALRVIAADLMGYVRAQGAVSCGADAVVQDITAQLEAALSLL